MSKASTSDRGVFEMIYRSADFSLCRTYRYTLWRVWNSKVPPVCFIGLNPSTADELEDDPTIRRCMRFAKAWGYGGLVMANLFAFRATDLRVMKAAIDPVGPDNDAWLRRMADRAGIVIAAWGNHGSFMGRDRRVAGIIENLHCLGQQKTGVQNIPFT
jgi:hypothetical protein